MIKRSRPRTGLRAALVMLLLALPLALAASACADGGEEPPEPTPTTDSVPSATQTAADGASPTATATPTPETSPEATEAGGSYVVQSGDTLSSIALEFGTTVEALVEANDIADPDQIAVGQELVIP